MRINMKKHLKTYLLFFSLVFSFMALPSLSNAQFSAPSVGGLSDYYIGSSLFYYSNLRTRTSRDEKSYFVYDIRAGYQVNPNIYLGLIYQADKDGLKASGYSSDSLNNTTSSQRASLGPTISYITETYHAHLTYFYSSKWKLDVVTNTGTNAYEYTGTGLQADFGYKFPVWGMLIGPQISYKKFTYTKLSTNGGTEISLSPKLEEDTFEPSLVIYFFF